MVKRRFVKVSLLAEDMKRRRETVYLTQEILDLLDYAIQRLGLTKSEIIRLAILDWLDNHNLITQKLHS